MPAGAWLWTSLSGAVQGSTIEKTFCSRMRRAMSCVYCAPKSRMTMDWLVLGWDSTDEFLKLRGGCKARANTNGAGPVALFCVVSLGGTAEAAVSTYVVLGF